MKAITVDITAGVPSEKVTDLKAIKIAEKDGVVITESEGKTKFDFGKVEFNMPEPSEMAPETVAAYCEAQFRVNERASYVDEKLASYGIETSGGKQLAVIMSAIKAANPKLSEEEVRDIAKTALAK